MNPGSPVMYALYHINSGHRDQDFTFCGIFDSEQAALEAQARILKNAPKYIQAHDFWIAPRVLNEVDEHPFFW